MIETITDEIFAHELNKTLKRRNMTVKARKAYIDELLLLSPENRDSILESELLATNSIIEAKAELKRIPLESAEQKNFIEWFRQTQDKEILMIRNDGSRTPAERNEQLLMGLKQGASDLLIPDGMIWIEMKRIKGGVWPKEQQAWKAYVESIGQIYLLCYGCEDAKRQLVTLYSGLAPPDTKL